MTKSELRNVFKSKRKSLTVEALDEMSLNIANACLKLPIWHYEFYHLFLPVVKLKEVNTEFLLHVLQGKDKNVIVSKSNFDTYEMRHFLLTETTKLVLNEYGIPEPEDGLEIASEKINVVFVPLLCFDNTGNRIGYGKGFYDRFLHECNEEAITVGLSCFEAIENTIEASTHDVKLDYCVTPENIFSFN